MPMTPNITHAQESSKGRSARTRAGGFRLQTCHREGSLALGYSLVGAASRSRHLIFLVLGRASAAQNPIHRPYPSSLLSLFSCHSTTLKIGVRGTAQG